MGDVPPIRDSVYYLLALLYFALFLPLPVHPDDEREEEHDEPPPDRTTW